MGIYEKLRVRYRFYTMYVWKAKHGVFGLDVSFERNPKLLVSLHVYVIKTVALSKWWSRTV